MIRERQKTGWISLKLFYARRTLRIFPPMYAIMGATLLYLWLVHGLQGLTWGGVCSQLFYYQNYYFAGGKGNVPGLGVLWSLAVEEHFYLLFPPLMLLFLDRLKMDYKQIARTLLVLCGVILLWRIFVVYTFSNGLEWARDTTDCRADSILYGCVLACWEKTGYAARIFTRRSLERYIVPGAIAVMLFTLLFRNPIFRETLRYTLQSLAIAPLLYYAVHEPTTRVGRILNNPQLAWLGTLSYGLYLLHGTVLLELNSVLPSKIIAAIIGLPVAVFLAWVVHVTVEKPTDAMRQKLRHTSNPAPTLSSLEQSEPSLAPAGSAK